VGSRSTSEQAVQESEAIGQASGEPVSIRNAPSGGMYEMDRTSRVQFSLAGRDKSAPAVVNDHKRSSSSNFQRCSRSDFDYDNPDRRISREDRRKHENKQVRSLLHSDFHENRKEQHRSWKDAWVNEDTTCEFSKMRVQGLPHIDCGNPITKSWPRSGKKVHKVDHDDDYDERFRSWKDKWFDRPKGFSNLRVEGVEKDALHTLLGLKHSDTLDLLEDITIFVSSLLACKCNKIGVVAAASAFVKSQLHRFKSMSSTVWDFVLEMLQEEDGILAFMESKYRASKPEVPKFTDPVEPYLSGLSGCSDLDLDFDCDDVPTLRGLRASVSKHEAIKRQILEEVPEQEVFELKHKFDLAFDATKVFDSLEPQGLENLFGSLQRALGGYGDVTNSPFTLRLIRFFSLTVGAVMCAFSNHPFDRDTFNIVERNFFESTWKLGADLFVEFCNLINYFATKGYEIYTSGSLDPLFHSGQHYAKWFEDYETLSRWSQFLQNPQPHNFTIYEYHQKLQQAIDDGTLIVKRLSYKRNDPSHKNANDMLCKLKKWLMEYKAAEFTQEIRQTPFSILVVGPSSIGKTAIMNMLFVQFGRLQNLPTDASFAFSLNADSEFMDGFQSYKWCIMMDDIAKIKPSRAPQGDPTLNKLIDIINPQPFMANMAKLEDKGQTPVLAKLVLSSSNADDVNAKHYFTCPEAILRRFNYKIRPTVKPQFSNNGMLDTMKIKNLNAISPDFPDYWIWDVTKYQSNGNGGGSDVAVLQNADLFDFLDWYNSAITEHCLKQQMVVDSKRNMISARFCAEHNMPCSVCASRPHNHLHVEGLPHGGPSQDDSDYDDDEPVGPPFNRMRLQGNLETVTLAMAGVGTIWSLYHLNYTVRPYANSLMDRLNYLQMLSLPQSYLCRDVRSIANGARILFRIERNYDNMRAYWHDVGERARSYATRPDILIGVAAAATAVLGIYMLTRKTSNDMQGNFQSAPFKFETPQPEPNERINVWHNDAIKTLPLDVGKVSKCCKGDNLPAFIDVVSRGCYSMKSRRADVPNSFTVIDGKCIAIGGGFFLANSHTLFSDCNIQLQLTYDSGIGPSRNTTLLLSQSRIYRDKKRDLALFYLEKQIPSKNIVDYFCGVNHQRESSGFYLSKDGGTVVKKQFSKLTYTPCTCVGLPDMNCHAWSGNLKDTTRNGDCGSVLILETSSGPAIAGLHVLGGKQTTAGQAAVAVSVDREWIVSAKEALTTSIGKILQSLCSDIPYVPPMLVDDGPHCMSAQGYPMNYGDVHPKSSATFITSGTFDVHGSLLGFRSSHKSQVEDTPMRAYWERYGITTNVVKPDLKHWAPEYRALSSISKKNAMIDQDILDICTADYIDTVFSRLPPGEIEKLVFLDRYTAINGAPGVVYCDPMKKNTSAGSPWCRVKSDLLIEITPRPGHVVAYDVPQEVHERIDRIQDAYMSGCRARPLYKAQKKDMALSQEKIDQGKVRVFTGVPLDASILMRQFLLSFIMLVQRNRLAFEMGVGTNCYSSEWGDILRYLEDVEDSNVVRTVRKIAGDYKEFDTSFSPEFILAYHRIIYAFYAKAGIPHEQLKIIAGIATDTSFAFVDWFGTLITCLGFQPSGTNITVVGNGMGNSTAMRICYYVLSPYKCIATFRYNVHLITYGDDNAAGVSEAVAEWYTQDKIAEVMPTLGFVYTDALKSDTISAFTPTDQMTFLKRSWVWDSELADYKCPLEFKSIAKSLCVWLKSKSETPQKQMLAIMESQHREMFQHSREDFDAFDSLVKGCIYELDLAEWVRPGFPPTWDTYVAEWKASSASNPKTKYSTGVRCYVSNHKHVGLDSYLNREIFELEISSLLNGYNQAMESVNSCGSLAAVSPWQNSPTHNLLCWTDEMIIQGSASNIVQMVAGEPEISAGDVSTLDETSEQGKSTNTNIEDVFSRWVAIEDITWTATTVIDTNFNPWYEFLINNSMMQSKLKGYAGFKCSHMELKFLINGSPYEYGAVLTSYKPLSSVGATGWDSAVAPAHVYSDYDFSGGHIELTSGESNERLMALSQRPHLWLYPQTCTGGVMKLPFLWYKNWVDLTISSNSLTDDVFNMGTINMVSPKALQYAGTTPSVGVGIVVYARIVGMELSRPTLTIQGSEYEERPVSATASAVAAAAGALSNVPVIGPYARATSFLVGAFASIARWFGFTAVPVIDPVHSVKNAALPQLHSTQIGVQLEKLSMDPKQELTIDPRTVGAIPIDQMAIKHICQKEAYIDVATWNVTDAASQRIFTGYVMPEYGTSVTLTGASSGTYYRHMMTPAGYIGQGFTYWTGDIIFNFKILCSQFHRGRLRFSYDPNGPYTTYAEGRIEQVIFDLTKETSFEIRIPYSSIYSYLPLTGGVFAASNANVWGNRADPSSTYNNNFANGYFRLDVLNPLNCSDSAAPAYVIMSMRMADNFELAVPSDLTSVTNQQFYSPFDQYLLQGAEQMMDDPSSTTEVTMPVIPAHDKKNMIYFGEMIASTRSPIQRASYYAKLCVMGQSFNIYQSVWNLPRFPVYPGVAATGLHATSTGQVANLTGMTYLHWLTPCFVGFRGTINYHLSMSGAGNNSFIYNMSLNRAPGSYFQTSYPGGISQKVFQVNKSTSTCSANVLNYTPLGIGGAAANTSMAGGGLQVAVPSYVNMRMFPANPSYYSSLPITSGHNTDPFQLTEDRIVVTASGESWAEGSTAVASYLTAYASAGQDFSCFFFLNVPTMFRGPVPTPSTTV